MQLDRACEGTLLHSRLSPVAHTFRYPVWLLLADVDGLDALHRVSPFLSVDRRNLLSLRADDHFTGQAGSLRARVESACAVAGVAQPPGPILLLTQPRTYGFDFNPVSFFFCLNRTATGIEHVLAEVTNTPWNQRHVYVLTPERPGASIICESRKALHVSPFNDMNLDYRWSFELGDDAIRVGMQLSGGDGTPHFHAKLDLRCRPLDAAAVRRAAFAWPAQSIATLVRIYREAFTLWRRGATFYTHPDRRKDDDRARHSLDTQ